MDRPCKYDVAGPESWRQDSGPFFCPVPKVTSEIKMAYTRIPVSSVKIEPEPRPVCRMFERCEGCPYPAHGFVCWGPDEGCLRSAMQKICTRKESMAQ